MKKRVLLEFKIKLLQHKIEKSISSINNGGCGRFALRAHRALNKMGIENEMLISAGRGSGNIDHKKDMLNNQTNYDRYELYDVSFSHCCVFIPKYNLFFDAIDMETIVNKDKANNIINHTSGVFSEVEMAKAIRLGSWNSWYDPAQNTKLSRLVYNTLK